MPMQWTIPVHTYLQQLCAQLPTLETIHKSIHWLMYKQVEYYSAMKTHELLRHEIRINLESIKLREKSDTKSYNLCNSHYMTFGKGKPTGMKLNQWLPVAKKQGRRLTTNNQQGTLGEDENVLYINYGSEHMPTHICQNSSHCTLTRGTFYCT